MIANDESIQAMSANSQMPRRWMLFLTFFIVVGIISAIASIRTGFIAYNTDSNVSVSATDARLASSRNNVELLEHRKRQEENFDCISEYIRQIVEAAKKGLDTNAIPRCRAHNLDLLDTQLEEARAILRKISPNDPALFSHDEDNTTTTTP